MADITRIKTKTLAPYPIAAISVATHDTKTFRFALPENATLDMLPGDHLYVHATINGKAVRRPYTPSSLPGTVGYFDLTIKRYETGITPMIAIIRWILTKRLDVELFLIFANKTEADIIFREEWDRGVREHPNFHCYHVLEQPPADWTMGVGRVTADMLRAHLPAPGPDTIVFLCGPPPMVEALESTLKDLGYSEEAVVLP